MNIRDIAKLAGVTHTTVSKILNNKGNISIETKKKVLSIIKKYNYYPNESARRVSLGKADEIAFISTRYASNFISTIIEGAEQKSYEPGKYYGKLSLYSTRGNEEAKKEILIRILRERLAAAVIMIFVIPDKKLIKEYKKAEIPIVLLEGKIKGIHSIRVDNKKGAYDAVSYLIKKGRKKIGLIRGEIGYEEVGPTPSEREKGYKDALKSAGFVYNKKLTVEVRDYTFNEGKQCLDLLLEREKKLDAIFCSAGDLCAMGVMQRAKELKIKIPDDIAIIGFDDIIAASLVSPALTTVKQPIYEIGQKAFELAVEAAEKKIKKPRDIVIQPELIIRESAG